MEKQEFIEMIVPEILEAYVMAISGKSADWADQPKYTPMELAEEVAVILPMSDGMGAVAAQITLQDMQQHLPFVRQVTYSSVMKDENGVSFFNTFTDEDGEEFTLPSQNALRIMLSPAWDALTRNMSRPKSLPTIAERAEWKEQMRAGNPSVGSRG